MNILTTQLQNQDPTQTTDTSQFTAELVQFAQVEQQLNTNQDLQTLINLQKNTGTGAVISYMGQYIEAPTTTGQLALQNGQAELGYTLPLTTKSATITIQDAQGNTVDTINAPTTTGLNYVTWNGQDSSGNQLADGAYTFQISATDNTGAAETITDTRVLGKVTGVTSTSTGTVNLMLGDGTGVDISTVDAIFGSSATNLPSGIASNASSTSTSS